MFLSKVCFFTKQFLSVMIVILCSNRFTDKTKNDFYHRDTFTKYPGKYDYVQLDYNPTVSDRSDLIGLLILF